MPEALPILALHGGGVTPALWDPVRAVAPELEIVAPDLNRIAAGLPAGADFDSLADAVVAVAPAGPLVLTGVGMGSRLSLLVAERIASTAGVLLMAAGAPHEDEAYVNMARGYRSFLADAFKEELIPTLLPVMLYSWGPRYRQAARELKAMFLEACGQPAIPLARVMAIFGPFLQHRLHRIEAPIELLYGKADAVFDPRAAALWRQLPQVRSVEVLEKASHMIPLDAPEEVAARLRRLVAAPR